MIYDEHTGRVAQISLQDQVEPGFNNYTQLHINNIKRSYTEAIIKHKQKTKLFRVNSDTGVAFRAVSELLKVDGDELLENLMTAYVSSVQKSIGHVARHYPVFAEKYPFVE